MGLRRRSSNVEVIPPPAPFDVLRNRPYGTPAAPEPEPQSISASYGPGEHLRELLRADGVKVGDAGAGVGFDPRRSAWTGVE